jgi:hypothetical protein
MEFKKELKYYTLFIALVALFGVFFKAMENPNRAMAICSPSELGIGETCDYRLPTPTLVLAEGHQQELVFTDPNQKLTYEIFGEKDWKTMWAIIGCESGYNPERTHIDDNEASIGLAQINIVKGNGEGLKVHWDKIPGEDFGSKIDWLKEPKNNLTLAKFIKATSGFHAWTCFSSGSYKKFL